MRTILIAFALTVLARSALADPAAWSYEGWETDFTKSSVDFSEVVSGGPPRDGIPSIDEPLFLPASQITDIEPQEPVIQFPLGASARAYPLRVLTWHEIVNDVVNGAPVAVTYCPLCNAAIVFDRRLDGQVLEFGTTGKLRRSDLVMYDRQTQTWWQQFSGTAIVGELTGSSLTLLPSRIVSFGDFQAEHPSGQVLVPNDPNLRPYGRNPYVGYDTATTPFLFGDELPDGIPAMAHVVIAARNDGGDPIIVTLERVREATYEVDGYRIDYVAGVASALDSGAIAGGREIGTVRVTRDGQDIVHHLTFAFVAHAFHPEVEIAVD